MLYSFKAFLVIDILLMISLGLFHVALAKHYKKVVSSRIIILALLTPAVAIFCKNIYIFYLYLVIAVAFNSSSREELASNFVFMLPLMPMLTVETRIGSVYLFAFSTVAAMGFGALIGFAVTRGPRPFTLARYDIAVLTIICIFVFIYSRDGGVLGILRGLAINTVSILGPYLLISRAMYNFKDIERLLLCCCLGGLLTAITAVFQAVRHWVVFQIYYENLRVPFPLVSFTLSLRGGLLRTGGSMIDYSAGGLFLASVLALLPLFRSRFRLLGFWIVVASFVGGLLATQSRGAWVAAFVGLLFVAVCRGAWGKAATIVGGVTVVQTLILVFATSGRLAAITGQTGEASGTISYRQLLATKGFRQILNHPWFGQSPADLVRNLSELTQGEHIVDFVNGHLFVAMAAGIPLFIVWLVVWAMPIGAAWQRRRIDDGNLIAASAAIVVTSMTALLFTSIIDRNILWPVIALALAGPSLVVNRKPVGLRMRAADASGMPSPGPILRSTAPHPLRV